jgi:hypothetical protein
VFRKGQLLPADTVAAGSTPVQLVPVSTWDDGSVKHALVAGTAALVAGAPTPLSITKSSTANPAAPALTEADLRAAAPKAAVTYGSYGTVSLAPLIGTSARVLTEHAGPEYAAFQYIGAFPADASVRAVFYVQLWKGGRYRVRVAVENGTAPASSSPKSGAASVTIAGVTRSFPSVAMPNGVRWDVAGANFAETAIRHDPSQLRASKLVPNYGYRQPDAATLAALPSGYVPMAHLGWEADMGATGFSPGIGLLPHWDALYAGSGDARAAASVLQHSSALGSYSVFHRDAGTRAMPLFSQYPTAYARGEEMTGDGTNPNRWEVAHHPNAGYLAWLMTAERFHLETLQANAYAAWITDVGAGKTGTDKLYSSQTRARAWRYRTIASAAAVSPDGDAFKREAAASIVANLKNWQQQNVVPNSPATGLAATYDDQDPAPGLQRSLFEHLFLVASIGWSWDQEMKLSAADKATLAQVRDYFYKVPLGLAGRGPAFGEYSWRVGPGPYRSTVGPTSSSYYATWGEVYQINYGDNLDSTQGLSLIGNYADAGVNAFPLGNWGHLVTALSYAVDHGRSGAPEAYGRITGASNWSTNAVHFHTWPQYGVVPR